ncbi:MAG: hypothetical protein IKH74_00775, partial [Lachnospiraceae bacterium]|nr:hypothetical protein [Lachnospiraceae bacterium]
GHGASLVASQHVEEKAQRYHQAGLQDPLTDRLQLNQFFMCIVYGKASFYSALAASIPRPAPDLPPFSVPVKFHEPVILVTLPESRFFFCSLT